MRKDKIPSPSLKSVCDVLSLIYTNIVASLNGKRKRLSDSQKKALYEEYMKQAEQYGKTQILEK